MDVDFKIGLPTVDQLVMKTALKLNSGDLSDIEYLAERLALAYGLSEADSLALSQMIDVQHAHIRSLQRHPLNLDTDSDIVSDFGSKSKQTTDVDFDTADLRDDEFSSLRLQGGDVARGIYRRTEQAEAKTKKVEGLGEAAIQYRRPIIEQSLRDRLEEFRVLKPVQAEPVIKLGPSDDILAVAKQALGIPPNMAVPARILQ